MSAGTNTTASAPGFNRSDHPHRRYNPLTGNWVLVSPHRAKRPWSGLVDPKPEASIPGYDPACPLCPGNERAGGRRNLDYTGPYVFDNDFAALTHDAPSNDTPPDNHLEEGFFRTTAVRGETRVLCFSPDHARTLPELPEESIADVFRHWIAETKELSARNTWVQIFENKGTMMGCSQPHPHGQIWASDFIPNELARRDEKQRDYFKAKGRPLLLDYLARELEEGERLVVETKHWVALTPYWAAWPFETMLMPRTHVTRLTDLTADLIEDGARALKELLIRYDNLFACSFPYSMGWHFAPFTREDGGGLTKADHWQLNAVFYPPLLRSAEVRKFMVGYEMLAEAQRDITPEQAAEALQKQSTTHYRTAP